MPQFRKKPVVIEAMLFTQESVSAIDHWLIANGLDGKCGWQGDGVGKTTSLLISTLEGMMRADEGDWIIKGVNGEFYPCKPDIFEATYEAVAA